MIYCATGVAAFISAIAPTLRNTNGWDVLDDYGCHPEREISDTKWNTDDSLLKASSKVLSRSGEIYLMLEALLENDSGIKSDNVFHSKQVLSHSDSLSKSNLDDDEHIFSIPI